MKRLTILLTLIIALCSLTAFAADTYEEYLKEQMSQYHNYLEQIDKDFSSFLKQNWKGYEGEKPKELFQDPKPVEAPVAKPVKQPEPQVIIPKKQPEKPKPAPEEEKPEAKPVPEAQMQQPTGAEPVVPEPSVPEPEVAQPSVPEPVPSYAPPQEQKKEGMRLSFYGRNLVIPYDTKISVKVRRPLSADNIASWWEAAASTDYKKTLAYLQKESKVMQLGDWGFVNLLERFCAKLSGDTPERKMVEWFFLNKAGYDAKLGYTKTGETKVMLPSDSQLYSVPFFTFSGVRYYVMDVFGKIGKPQTLYTYKGKYPGAIKPLRLSYMKYPELGFSAYKRDLRFKYDGREHDINTVANKYSVAFLNNFPQAYLSVYTEAQTPQWIDKTMLPQLKKLVAGKSPRDAVNLLLRFVQTAFSYKTDDKQFGREKFLFTEETIYYPYSDCEDRSIIFAHLVQKLLGLKLIMLDFPDHIAVAVDLGNQNTGAVVEYKGRKYSVTDPTYINANAGMVMPEYRNVSPGVIEPDL